MDPERERTLELSEKDVINVLEIVLNEYSVDRSSMFLTGHSMGSGVALLYGFNHPNTVATIAISPVKESISPTLPHNLLLMAGSLEPQFVANAQDLLDMAGGQNADLANGTARKLEIIPNVEHISILFSPTAHSTARSWL